MDRQTGILDRILGPPDAVNPAKRKIWAALLQYVPGQISCRDFESFLIDYHERTLSLRQRRIFELHMRICPLCWVYVHSYLRAVSMGKRVFDDPDDAIADDVPEDLISAIVSARSAR